MAEAKDEFYSSFDRPKNPIYGRAQTTNNFFFHGTTSITRTATGLITSGSVAQTFGTVTPLQALASMPGGVANLGALGTIGTAGINTAINAILSAIALEAGVSVGSLVNSMPLKQYKQEQA